VIGNTASAACKAGGKTIEVAGEPATKKDICNGEEGSPWTAEGTLPSEATETGSYFLIAGGSENDFTAISFPIPLAKAAAENIEIKFGGDPAHPDLDCAGTAKEPQAAPGVLCLYEAPEPERVPNVYPPILNFEGAEGIGTGGALLAYRSALPAGLQIFGSFAITAP
jgi:hypothetical protein